MLSNPVARRAIDADTMQHALQLGAKVIAFYRMAIAPSGQSAKLSCGAFRLSL